MNQFRNYWYQPMIAHDANFNHKRKMTPAKRLVITALLGSLAAILQSAGNLIPGIGLFISPFATLPIFFAICYSTRTGILSYILTILLLFIIEPSELIVFPFTTGLLGIALGVSFIQFKRRIWIVSFSAICLLIGIMVVLDIFRFPVLGPTVHTTLDMKVILSIFILSFLYCWIYAGLCRIMLNRVYKIWI
ncbi:hypothetical protein [Bacillus wiedmannii]|uniref:hypothetical protein n=1 Tax=Bacillus wiedmannii TaxID=1890302 RepID=UPI000BF0DF4B|nr:hypothetical protein [Bacillus wiedmannii]PEM53259.1 hypothetical protein CN618_05500 [Bacillus wiedmannii]PHA04320.1 hypothetical protein COE63_04860 [Bacillus wiedmannii]PHA36072.1 hypothetical protein COE69_04270 [Bacillus wiedmannii]PHD26274.1 hypothetical protein COF37_08075 [Bacillus wiedmannii]